MRDRKRRNNSLCQSQEEACNRSISPSAEMGKQQSNILYDANHTYLPITTHIQGTFPVARIFAFLYVLLFLFFLQKRMSCSGARVIQILTLARKGSSLQKIMSNYNHQIDFKDVLLQGYSPPKCYFAQCAGTAFHSSNLLVASNH